MAGLAATSAFYIAIGSNASYSCSRASFLPQSQVLVVSVPSYLRSASSISGLDSSFLSKAFCGSVTKAKTADKMSYGLKINAAYKVAILGATERIGPYMSIMLSVYPLVSRLHLYDDTYFGRNSLNSSGKVDWDDKHCPAEKFHGLSELQDSLKEMDVVLITRGVPRRVNDDFIGSAKLIRNANQVKEWVEAIAANSPKAYILIVSPMLSFVVPLAAEVLKRKGVYDPNRLLGITSVDVSMAKNFIGKKLQTNMVHVPVVGGQGGTSLPLLSQTKPSLNMTEEEMEKLALTIQNATILLMSGGDDAPHTVDVSRSVIGFVKSFLEALNGKENVYEYAFVPCTFTDVPFFASRVKLGTTGVEEVTVPDFQGLTRYEKRALETLKPALLAEILKGTAFGAFGN